LGNGIDPLDVIELHGADAMKFTLCYMAAQGQDILIDMDSFKMGSRFANKIWNATRFLLMNLDGRSFVGTRSEEFSVIDCWMYHQLNDAAAKVAQAIQGYRFNDAAQTVYDLFWNDFCDWYVEATKSTLATKGEVEKDRTVSVMLDLLAELMRLLHPFVSFITEEIYGKLPNTTGRVIDSRYPVWTESRNFPEQKTIVALMQEAVRGIRTMRSELQIPTDKKLHVVIRPDKAFPATDFLVENQRLVAGFVGASVLSIDSEGKEDVSGAMPVAGPGFETFVFVREAIDVDHEIGKLETDLAKNEVLLEAVLKKLSNEKFLENAKPEIIEKEQGKRAEFEEKLEKGRKHLMLLRSL
jgi:valyl-tRNA synthetase